MRQIGTIASPDDAQRFCDYLLTLGVTARIDGGDTHSVWVFEENDVECARAAFEEFNRDPREAKFAAAGPAAAKIRQDKIDGRRKAQSNVIELGDRWQRPTRSRQPLTALLIALSVTASVMTGELGLGEPRPELLQLLQISAGGSPLHEVLAGQVWRLITPIFLHFNLMHLLFDMYMLYLLGSLIELRRGTLLLAVLVLTSAVASNVGQYLDTGPRFGGMSGVDYALFGYAWMQSRFSPRGDIYIGQNTVVLMIVWLLVCMFSKMAGDVANTAHLVGLAVGMIAGYLPTVLRH